MTRVAPRSRRAAAAARARHPVPSERRRGVCPRSAQSLPPRSDRRALPRPLHATKVHTSPTVESSSEIRGRLIAAEHSAPKQGAIETALLLSAAPDRQRIGIGTGVAARTERQARDDPRRVVGGRQQMRPPRIGFSCLRQRQYADRALLRRQLRGSLDPPSRKPTSACCCRNGRAPDPRNPADRQGRIRRQKKGIATGPLLPTSPATCERGLRQGRRHGDVRRAGG